MSGSDEKTKQIHSLERAIGDTACRSHRAQTDSLRFWLKTITVSALTGLAGGVGWGYSLSGDMRAMEERNAAQALQIVAVGKRVDDYGRQLDRMEDKLDRLIERQGANN